MSKVLPEFFVSHGDAYAAGQAAIDRDREKLTFAIKSDERKVAEGKTERGFRVTLLESRLMRQSAPFRNEEEV